MLPRKVFHIARSSVMWVILQKFGVGFPIHFTHSKHFVLRDATGRYGDSVLLLLKVNNTLRKCDFFLQDLLWGVCVWSKCIVADQVPFSLQVPLFLGELCFSPVSVFGPPKSPERIFYDRMQPKPLHKEGW